MNKNNCSKSKSGSIVFYLGYSNLSQQKSYGSELAAIKLAKSFINKNFDVYMLSCHVKTYIDEGIIYMHYDNFEKLNISVDILIISRYINYFIDYDFNPGKIFLWFHDVSLCDGYHGLRLKNNGGNLLSNCINKIDGFIMLTNWHKKCVLNYYPNIPHNKTHIIGNGIDTCLFNCNVNKIKNRFIYTSHFNRGLEYLIECFHKIVEVLPDAELHIFRDYDGYENKVKEWSKYSYIEFHGKVSNEEIIQEFGKADVWFYPTSWEETYCISALEAQMSKTLCICSDLAALKEVVSERGILIDYKEINNVDICLEMILNSLSDLNSNELREKGYNWAKKQDWNNIADKWIPLFNL